MEDLAEASLITAKELAKASEDNLMAIVRKHSPSIDASWLQPLASEITKKHRQLPPDTRQAVMALTSLHGIANSWVVNTYLQEAFGFFAGLAIDMDFRRMVVALEMLDTNEIGTGSLSIAKISPAHIEKSLETWLEPIHWQAFQQTLKSVQQLLSLPPAGKKTSPRSAVEKVVRDNFAEHNQHILFDMLSRVATMFKVVKAKS